MKTMSLPSRELMLAAFQARDASYDGVFVTAVRTTGIFCRPTCSARKPRPEHVEFFATSQDALLAGYRPCRRCHPMEPGGATPAWLAPLIEAVEREPDRRWRDGDLRALGLEPERVRRWFQKHHGMTFHAYSRARRLGQALGRVQHGEEVTAAAFDSGYDSLSGFNAAFRRLMGEAPSSMRGRTRITLTRLATPLGPMVAGANDDALCLLEFADRRMLSTQLVRMRKRFDAVLAPGTNAVLDRAAAEIADYFAGRLRRFAVPIETPGTDFQRTVWRALLEVPYGARASYADLAHAIGMPRAVRAVARANGDNRIAIIVPCHRIVGRDGKLTGYGGGLWRKQRLLDLERAHASSGQPALFG